MQTASGSAARSNLCNSPPGTAKLWCGQSGMGAESFGFVGTVAHGNSTAHHLENTYSFFKDIDMKRAEESSALIQRAHQLHPLEFRLGHRATPAKLSRPNRGLQGSLYGVPIFLKDLGSGLIGRTQDSGSGLTRGTVMKATDPTIENFLHAGLVPLGRSSTPEFGLTFDTLTKYDGEVTVTRNPWNLERTSGGSSGGSGVVAATGTVPLSMSSDGGGSTRYPAAFCGLVGLKATRGRVPQPLIRNE